MVCFMSPGTFRGIKITNKEYQNYHHVLFLGSDYQYGLLPGLGQHRPAVPILDRPRAEGQEDLQHRHTGQTVLRQTW